MAQQRVNLTDSGKDAIMKLDSNCYDLSRSKFDATSLVHTLTSTDANKPLAADQGPAIQALLDTKADKATVTSGMTFKGTCTYATLPTTNNTNGDFWYCTDTETNYGWTNTAWVALGDLNYSNVEALDEDFEELQANFDTLETKADIDKKPSRDVADGKKISDTFDMSNATQIYDAGNAQASSIKIYGETVEIGTGTKSPSNPYTIKSLGENERKVVVRNCGKNLLENRGTTQTVSGVTFTKNSDGSVLVNGTCTNSSGIYYTLNITQAFKDIFDDVSTYYLSGCPSGSATTYALRIDDSAGNSKCLQYGNTNVSFTKGTGISGAYIRVYGGATVNNVLFKPMLRLTAIEDATYEPYISSKIELPIKSSTVTTGLNYALGKWNDNVYDVLDWDNKQIKRRTKLFKLTGATTENWAIQDSSLTNTIMFKISNVFGQRVAEANVKTNMFLTSGSYYNTDAEGICTGSSSDLMYVRINKSRLTANTVDAFKTWLSTNNLNGIALIGETIEDIDATLADQRLYTYEDLTNVIEETSIQGKLDMTYVGRNNNYANDIVNNKKYLFYLQMNGSQPQLVTREV